MNFLDTASTTHAPRASSRFSHALRTSTALYCTRTHNRERKWLHLCSLLRWHCNLTLCTVFLLAQDCQRQVGSATVAVVIAAVVIAAAVAAADPSPDNPSRSPGMVIQLLRAFETRASARRPTFSRFRGGRTAALTCVALSLSPLTLAFDTS